MEQERFFSEEEKKKFEDFALALDSAIVNKYHGVLQELKVGFDFSWFRSGSGLRRRE